MRAEGGRVRVCKCVGECKVICTSLSRTQASARQTQALIQASLPTGWVSAVVRSQMLKAHLDSYPFHLQRSSDHRYTPKGIGHLSHTYLSLSPFCHFPSLSCLSLALLLCLSLFNALFCFFFFPYLSRPFSVSSPLFSFPF